MKYSESETVELKKTTSEMKEAVTAIAAILNKHGHGKLYFGIRDDGTVIGQQIGTATVKDISKSITDHIDPKIYPDIRIQKIDGKDCLVVIFSGHENLYSAFGRYYLRSGDENKKLSTKEIERLVEKKRNYVYSWGTEVSEIRVSDANISTLRSFIKRGKEAGRIGFAFDTANNVLNRLNLIKGDKLLNAGRALFCKNNGLEVRAAIFATNEKLTFLDIQSFKGTLFDLINQCETYVKEHINWRADIVDFKRIETPEIPISAVREAILNSLCHRDFSNPGGNELAIYRNRIEIYNPGQFPYDYAPAEFIAGKGKSIPRNPLIADAFYLGKDIERWGSGLKRIAEECKAAGVKVEFEKIKSGFQVIFYRPEVAPLAAKKGARPVSDQDRLGERLGERLGDNRARIIAIMMEHPAVSTPLLAKKIGISTTAIEKNIGFLRRKKLIKHIGPARGGHWEVRITAKENKRP